MRSHKIIYGIEAILAFQLICEVSENFARNLPEGSVSAIASNSITASSQLITFCALPAITLYHENQQTLTLEQSHSLMQQTKQQLEPLLSNPDVHKIAAALLSDEQILHSIISHPSFLQKRVAPKFQNSYTYLAPTLLITLAYLLPIILDKASFAKQEDIQSDTYYNIGYSAAVVIASLMHIISAALLHNRAGYQHQAQVHASKVQRFCAQYYQQNAGVRLAIALDADEPDIGDVNRVLQVLREPMEKKYEEVRKNLEEAINDNDEFISNYLEAIIVQIKQELESPAVGDSSITTQKALGILTSKLQKLAASHKESLSNITFSSKHDIMEIKATLLNQITAVVQNFLKSYNLSASVQNFMNAKKISSLANELELNYKEIDAQAQQLRHANSKVIPFNPINNTARLQDITVTIPELSSLSTCNTTLFNHSDFGKWKTVDNKIKNKAQSPPLQNMIIYEDDDDDAINSTTPFLESSNKS